MQVISDGYSSTEKKKPTPLPKKPPQATPVPVKPKMNRKPGFNLNGWTDAHLSLACYSKRNGSIPSGWSILDDLDPPRNHPSSLFNAASGLYAIAYKHEQRKQIVIAVRGSTHLSNWLKGNLNILFNTAPFKEINLVEPFLLKLKKQFPTYAFRLTGHSLGASVALYLNLKHNLPGHIFECPGIGSEAKKFSTQCWSKQLCYNLIPNEITLRNRCQNLKYIKLYCSLPVLKEVNSLKSKLNRLMLIVAATKNPIAIKELAETKFAILSKSHDMRNIVRSIHELYQTPKEAIVKPLATIHRTGSNTRPV